MKTMTTYAVALLLAFCFHTLFAQGDELSGFLAKLHKYKETHQPRATWRMPVAKQESRTVPMPSPVIIGYMEDPETGLRYYPVLQRVYDPATAYTYDPASGKIYDRTGAEVLFTKLQAL